MMDAINDMIKKCYTEFNNLSNALLDVILETMVFEKNIGWQHGALVSRVWAELEPVEGVLEKEQ